MYRQLSLWGTHLNLPRVRFKRCVGSKQAVLREKPAHKTGDNIGLSQTTQSIVIVTSHGGGSCSECWFARQLGDTIYLHRYRRFLRMHRFWLRSGINVATCVICHEQYVGQTSNKFSKRWSAHSSNWNKQNCKTDSDTDQMALSRHYSENHGTINKPPLHEAYTVTFVENQVVTLWISVKINGIT